MSRESWELGGLVDANSDAAPLLGKVPDEHGIYVAPDVELSVSDDGTEWVRFAPPSLELPWRHRESTNGLLDKFVGLADADSSRILAFARAWGPLYVSNEHRDRHWSLAVMVHANPMGLTWSDRDPVDHFRECARDFQTLLNATAAIRRGVPVSPTDMQLLGFDSSTTRIWASDATTMSREIAAKVTEYYGRLSDPPAFALTDGLTLVIRAGFGFFAAAWLALVQTIARRKGLYVCDGCGNAYSRERQPQRGRQNYCLFCGHKAAKRAYERRQRAERRRQMEGE